MKAIAILFLVSFSWAAQENPLKPKGNWFIAAKSIEASENKSSLFSLKKKKQASWNTTGPGDSWFSFRIESEEASDYILTYNVAPYTSGVFEELLDSAKGIWKNIENLEPGPFLNKVSFRLEGENRYRFRLFRKGKKAVKVWNLGIYKPSSQHINDYWLALGASIQNQSMRHSIFNPEIRRRVSGSNPILFNMAVKGWGVEDVIGALPAMFESHPYASFVLLHVGGNNISKNRPYPGGAEELQNSLQILLEEIKKAGKIPVLSRISYRKYAEPYIVPPDSNGSGPYVYKIYDPLIARYSPDFYNWNKRKGLVDFYSLIKSNPKYLSEDGVHLSARGEVKWCEYWAKNMAQLVYLPSDNYDYTGPSSFWVVQKNSKSILFSFRNLKNSPIKSQIKILDKTKKTVIVISNLNGETSTKITWDLKDSQGVSLSPGLYYFQINLGRKHYSGKIIVNS